MPRGLRTPQAEDDLVEVWAYIAEDSEEAADRFLGRIENACRRLAENPLTGRDRSQLAPRLRSLAMSSYVLFYRPRSDGIELIRVLHGARDLPALFGESAEE